LVHKPISKDQLALKVLLVHKVVRVCKEYKVQLVHRVVKEFRALLE
jgi:hypothetical protein